MCLDLWCLPRLLHNFLGGIPWIKSWNPTNSPLKPPVALSPWCIAAETAVTENTVQPPYPPPSRRSHGEKPITTLLLQPFCNDLFMFQVFIPFCTRWRFVVVAAMIRFNISGWRINNQHTNEEYKRKNIQQILIFSLLFVAWCIWGASRPKLR